MMGGWLTPAPPPATSQHILKREVAKYEQEHITNGTALGELDHPNYASQYFKCLNLPNASHQVSCWNACGHLKTAGSEDAAAEIRPHGVGDSMR